MKTPLTLCAALLATLCLSACGPREVGEGLAEDYSYNAAREPEDFLRYPMGNNALQQRLYMMNQPERMVTRQKKQRDMQLRMMGLKPGELESQDMPQQRSPFRE